ncbi:MAG: hypothetical protein KDF65_04225 [Anaerolineae bacterium]|nr:hypothetical protein [Anaerolineae bacterium]
MPDRQNTNSHNLNDFLDSTAKSPLGMVTTEPLLNELVMNLQQLREDLLAEPTARQELQFSRAKVDETRAAFSRMIRQGEQKLHRLCELICDTFLASYQMQSIIIGEVTNTKERFTILQPISRRDLYSHTDLDLGSRQLEKLLFHDGTGWGSATLVANMVDYQPTEPNRYNVQKITSRIKAEEEIWNKVVDEIFDLDTIVTKDKQLRHLSRYVKDIFGIKVVVGELDDISRMQKTLENSKWSHELLRKLDIEPTMYTERLQFIEVKNYLEGIQRKRTGWEAIKSVVAWSNKTFEIQIQSLRNYLREQERLTKESHTSFKANREQVRAQVAERIPLFGFYPDLLLCLFLNPDGEPPSHERVILRVID